MRKVGLMGGTFNPIHRGHVLLAEEALLQCGLDEVWFIPSGCSYLKKQDSIASAQHRLAMTQLAINGNPSFRVSTIEIDRPGNSYTCETLAQLHEENPETEFFLILGADNLVTMESWYHPEEIFSSCVVICAVRDDCDMETLAQKRDELQARFSARIMLLKTERMDVSSTEIRDALAKADAACSPRMFVGGVQSDALSAEVFSYIRENGLYE